MELSTQFEKIYHHPPALLCRAPGRVNLLGEHIDYNGGPVLPAAIDRTVRIAAAPISESVVRLAALDLKKEVTFSLERACSPRRCWCCCSRRASGWTRANST